MQSVSPNIGWTATETTLNVTGELTFPLHLSVQVPTSLIIDPLYAESVIVVCLMAGLLHRCVCIFSGRALASAPVSSLNVIFPLCVETVESHEDS